MKLPPIRANLALAVDAALLVICLLHIPVLLDRPRAPFELTQIDDRVRVDRILSSAASSSLRIDDTLLAWNGEPLRNKHEVEFITDFLSVEDAIPVSYIRNEIIYTDIVRLIPAYDTLYIAIILVVGVIAWGLGVFVLLRRPSDVAALILHWALVTMGVTVMLTFGKTTPDSDWMYLTRPLFFLVYGSVAAAFLHFTLVFPRCNAQPMWRIPAVYVPLALLVFAMSYLHIEALNRRSVAVFDTYHVLFDMFHIVLIVYVLFALVLFVRSYLRSDTLEERKKLKWILWGLTVGPLPFLLLTVIPQYYLPFGFVPEEFTLVFLIIIPIAFAISFVRYHIFDIEVVINRTTVYGIVLGTVISVYVVIVALVAEYVGTNTIGNSATAAVFVALLFEPVRKRVQYVVDKKFFRIRYNFREVLRRISKEITRCITAQQLADLLIGRIDEFIPVQRIGVFLLRQRDKRLYVLSHRGFELLERRTIRFQIEGLKTELHFPVGLDANIEPGVEFESADEHVFTRWGIALVLPMKSATGEFIGFLVLGGKKSGERFRIEDVDLLANIAAEAGMEFERIALQHKLIDEQVENQRLIELNRMKSDFVSNVSHELRTPLTSIKLYAEMLGTDRPSTRKIRSYTKTIVGETDRLDRMVTNVLDSSKIERGVKHYEKHDIDLRAIVSHVLVMMKYQLDKYGFKIIYAKPRRGLQIHADPDAVAEAIMNLIDNAVKFSTTKRFVKISLRRSRHCVRCSVQDKGRGLSSDAIPHLFERFYRDPASSSNVQGVGLGLPLVQHIMHEHGGGVEVTSAVGVGSTFTLWFPIQQTVRGTKKENPCR